ncbi:hypothetical protein CHARACLAT_009864 [Characodon lateralis]|uniref:Uncharacterized protein n=1 Tax=Characodon lateralis TaxID=208331 RepID=A0ABU7E8J0_9TELE|nr:hypothetical protein [Characodon lateralis]
MTVEAIKEDFGIKNHLCCSYAIFESYLKLVFSLAGNHHHTSCYTSFTDINGRYSHLLWTPWIPEEGGAGPAEEESGPAINPPPSCASFLLPSAASSFSFSGSSSPSWASVT